MRRAIANAAPALGLLLITPELAAQVGSMRVTVPSPTAASLGKFGDVPVSLYTGVPDISIPLFTAKGKTLELPIALKYHASGIRVEEIGGWVGLGWTLEAGGTITRTVRGLVDESTNGYYNTGNTFYDSANWPTPTSTTIIRQIATEDLDGEPDQFFFSLAGRAGEFVIGPTSASTTEFRPIPYQKLRIQPTITGVTGLDIKAFVITAEDGTQYTFDAKETTTDFNVLTGDKAGEPEHYGESHSSSWHLTEIRSPGGDVINLYYTPYTVRHRIGTYSETFHLVQGQCTLSNFGVTNEYQVGVQRLDSITTATHTITFTTTLRSDARSPVTGAAQEHRLDKISVTTPGGVVLRTFQFEHDYFAGNRLRLKNVYEQDRTGASLSPYSFIYDAQGLPPYSSFAQDHWGYYNGQTGNQSLLPTTRTPGGIIIPGANRDPDPTRMQMGVLKKITYPTGGSTELFYEANDYGAIGANAARPIGEDPPESVGLYWDPGMPIQTTNFTIGGIQAVTATLTLNMNPSTCDPKAESGCPIVEIVGKGSWSAPGTHYVSLDPDTYTLKIWDNSENTSASVDLVWRERNYHKKKVGGGLRIAEMRTTDAMGGTTSRKYRYVLQSDTTTSSGIVGAEPRYDYSYSSSTCAYYSRSSMSRMPLGSGSAGQVTYREVTVLHGPDGEHGTTRRTYRSVLDAPDGSLLVRTWPYSRRTSHEWARGQETSVVENDALGRAQHQVVSTHRFGAETDRAYRGISVNSFAAGKFGDSYVYNPFELLSVWGYQDGSTTTVYDPTGTSSFSTTKGFVYGNAKHAQLTAVVETNSDGTQRITRMKYPADYAPAPGTTDPVVAALTAMQGPAHIHNAIIERWVIEKVGTNEKIVQAELTTWRNFGVAPVEQYLPFQRFVLNSPSPLP